MLLFVGMLVGMLLVFISGGVFTSEDPSTSALTLAFILFLVGVGATIIFATAILLFNTPLYGNIVL